MLKSDLHLTERQSTFGSGEYFCQLLFYRFRKTIEILAICQMFRIRNLMLGVSYFESKDIWYKFMHLRFGHGGRCRYSKALIRIIERRASLKAAAIDFPSWRIVHVNI